MTGTEATAATRVTTRDGTEIAYWTSGQGPPFVVAHGTTADHTRWVPLLPFLEPHRTVHAMDRRGRGGSGDAPDYDVAREFEDVAAVVDAVAEASGSAVDVYGHSYGALCSLGAATLTSNIRKLVIYEPPGGSAVDSLPPGVADRMDELFAQGEPEAVIETMFGEVLGMTAAELTAFKAAPSWPARVAAAQTVPRELRVDLGRALDREQLSSITVPTLMLIGAESPDWLKADAEIVASTLSDARVVVLEGQAHVADVLVPEVFASHVLDFLGGE